MWTRTMVCLAALVAVTGCGSSSDDSGTSKPKMVTYSGIVSEIKIGSVTPIDGVKLSSPDHPAITSATTDANGAYTLQLLANTKLTALGTKSGYLDAMTFVVTADQDVTDYNGTIISEDTAKLAYTAAGLGAPDPAKGTISIGVQGADGKGLAGATIKLTTGTGSGPVYTNGATFDKTATATVSGGSAFGAVTPGDITLEVTLAGKTCAPKNYGWPSTTGTVDGKAVANTVSNFIVLCQ